MALYVRFANGTEITLHVGVKPNSHLTTMDVTEVQADGHELDRIYAAFGGFTPHAVRVQRFFGDQAKYIFANWY